MIFIIFFISILYACIYVLFYLWKKRRLSYENWVRCFGLSLVLGVACLFSLLTNYQLYMFLIASYILAFMYFKYFRQFDWTTERTLLSISAGIIISVISLTGCFIA